MTFQSGRCFFRIRSFSLMSTSKGLTLDEDTLRQSSMSLRMSSSFLSRALSSAAAGILLHLRRAVDGLDGDDVRGPVRDGDYRRRYHDVLRVGVLLPLGEYHLEDRLS